jgi:hypothetical protein
MQNLALTNLRISAIGARKSYFEAKITVDMIHGVNDLKKMGVEKVSKRSGVRSH